MTPRKLLPQEKVDAWCPLCSCPGPHERIQVDQDGSSILVRCVDTLCPTEWTVSG